MHTHMFVYVCIIIHKYIKHTLDKNSREPEGREQGAEVHKQGHRTRGNKR